MTAAVAYKNKKNTLDKELRTTYRGLVTPPALIATPHLLQGLAARFDVLAHGAPSRPLRGRHSRAARQLRTAAQQATAGAIAPAVALCLADAAAGLLQAAQRSQTPALLKPGATHTNRTADNHRKA